MGFAGCQILVAPLSDPEWVQTKITRLATICHESLLQTAFRMACSPGGNPPHRQYAFADHALSVHVWLHTANLDPHVLDCSHAL